MTGLFTTMLSADVSGGALAGVSDAVSLFGKVWDLIVGNPILMVFIGIGLLSAGIGLFGRLLHTTKRAA